MLLYVEDQAKLLCRLQLIGSNRCEPVEVSPETIGRDYRSRSDSHRASPMPCNKVQGYLTTQRNPSVFYWGLRSQCVFFSCRLLIQIESVCGMPSVDKSTNASTCLRGKVFVQKHLNRVSAVAIPALGINPSLRLRFIL